VLTFAWNAQRVWARHNRSRRSHGADIPHHLPYHVYHHNHHCWGVLPNLPLFFPTIPTPAGATSRKHWKANQAAPCTPLTNHPFSKKLFHEKNFREPGSPCMSSVKEAVFDSRPSNATRAILTNPCRRRKQAILSQSCHHLTACLVLSRRQVFRSRAPAFLNSQDIIAYSLNCPADDTSANCLQRAFVMRMTFAHALFHLVCNHPCRPSLAHGVRFWYLVVGDIPSDMHRNYRP
jgi:hypothetical protein